MRLAIALFSAALFVSAPVAAQDPGEEVTTYDFSDPDEVRGERAVPWMERIPARLRGSRQTLIRPRAHFVPEMLRSVERL